ncbi:MAG: hypothetical protein AAF851_19710 [Myxococcota bacterium]
MKWLVAGLVAGAIACSAPEPEDGLVVALTDIHRRPRLDELRRSFDDIEAQLIALAENTERDWLVRSRSYEVLAESRTRAARDAIKRALADPQLPSSVRRALHRIRPQEAAR